MLPCIAAVAMATFVGKKTFESYENERSSLFMQNVEALTSNENSGESPCSYGYSKFKTERPWPWSDEEQFTYCNGCVDKKGYSPSGSCL